MLFGKHLLFVFAYLYSFSAYSQQFPFANYSTQNGLVNPRVRSIFQDSKGRLYIASFGGLSVFDGARFTNYTTENGLASNMVNDVVEMGEDSLLIFTNTNKLNCLVQGKLKKITPDGFCPIINKLVKSPDGFYYALTDDGLFRFENNRFSRVEVRSPSGKPINKYFADGLFIKNKLFIITDAGFYSFPSPSYLIIYDPTTHQGYVSRKPPDITALAPTPGHDILVATSEGVKALDTIALQKGEVRFIALPSLYKKASGIFARHLYFDREQNLWLATQWGVYKIDRNGKMVLYSAGNGLPTSDYHAVFQDREHIIWFISEQTGISKLVNPGFEWYAYSEKEFIPTNIYADRSSDTVWLVDGMKNKIRLIYPEGSKEFFIKNLPEPVNMVLPQQNSNYLISQSTVYRLHYSSAGNTMEASSFFFLPAQGPGITTCLADDHGNAVFVKDKLYVVLSGKNIKEYPLDYLADQFWITKDNYLWVITRGYTLYLFRLHPEMPDQYFELIKKYGKNELPRLSPRAITVDFNGNVWIGNRDEGLFCFYLDKKMNIRSWQQITIKNGLSDNNITYLHCDDEGSIWTGTASGLDKVRLRDSKTIVENITRPVDLNSNIAKIQTDRTGRFWILTRSGSIITMYPSHPSEQIQTRIFFTEVKAGGDTLPNIPQHLVLSYKQNDLSFRLAAPSFLNEKQTRFCYRLLGSNNSAWSEPLADADIHFQSLAPGKYTLQAKAIFLNGYYQDTMISYSFKILPPWWQTWWFRLLQVLVLGFIILLVAKNYTRRKLEKQRMQMEKQQALEKERARIASDIHDDLGAGLSSIRFLSEKVKRNANDVTKNDVEKMADISLELIENMNEIIWAMNEKNDTLEDLLYYSRSYAKEYCEENGLDCEILFPENIPPAFVSGEFRRNIFLIIKECLHNIVKYAEASQVVISINLNDHLELLIKDNGKGFSIGAPNGATTGNGLRNMKKRIEFMGGSLVFSNNPGASVHMQVPLQKPFLLSET